VNLWSVGPRDNPQPREQRPLPPYSSDELLPEWEPALQPAVCMTESVPRCRCQCGCQIERQSHSRFCANCDPDAPWGREQEFEGAQI
jgi:hypothetical protein